MAAAPEDPTKCVSNPKILAQGSLQGYVTWGCWCCVCSAQHLAGSSPEVWSGPAGQSPSRQRGCKDRAGCLSPAEAWACPSESLWCEGAKTPTTPAGCSLNTKNLWSKIWSGKRGLQLSHFFSLVLKTRPWTGSPVPFTLSHSCTSQHLIFFVVNCSKQDLCHVLNSRFPLS